MSVGGHFTLAVKGVCGESLSYYLPPPRDTACLPSSTGRGFFLHDELQFTFKLNSLME